MSSISLTLAQHAILAHALEHADGRIEWFPPNIQGGARQKVLGGLAKRELIRQSRKRWLVAAEDYDALGVPRPNVKKRITNAEGAPPAPNDAELEAAVTAAEASWAKPTHAGEQPAGPCDSDAPASRRRNRPPDLRSHRLADPHRARCIRRGVQEEFGPDAGIGQAARRRMGVPRGLTRIFAGRPRMMQKSLGFPGGQRVTSIIATRTENTMSNTIPATRNEGWGFWSTMAWLCSGQGFCAGY